MPSRKRHRWPSIPTCWCLIPRFRDIFPLGTIFAKCQCGNGELDIEDNCFHVLSYDDGYSVNFIFYQIQT